MDRLRRLDNWMTLHPWHPRVTPWVVYLVLLALIMWLHEQFPVSYPFLYTFQCGVVVWLLWRYRRLMPELTLSFHWLAVPAGLGVACLWIGMGDWMTATFAPRFDDAGVTPFVTDDQMGPIVGWTAMGLRLVGMSVVVPMFEEMFNRSLLLRSLHRMRRTGQGLLQVMVDFPMIGDWLRQTKAGDRADQAPPVFGPEFETTPFGRLSVFGVLASTLLFVSVHGMRDWPACFVCGVVYCLVVAATRRKGLGPVIWTHGITNAALWGYTIWQHFYAQVPFWRYL